MTETVGPQGEAHFAGVVQGVFGQSESLTHLDLNTNILGSHGSTSLPRVLTQYTVLTHLNLLNNELEDTGTGSLVGVLGL